MNYVETVFDFMFDVFLKALLSITDDCSHKRAGSELEANNYWK